MRQLLILALGFAATAGAFSAFVLAVFTFLAAFNREFVLLTIAAIGYTFACGYVASNLHEGTPGPWRFLGWAWFS